MSKLGRFILATIFLASAWMKLRDLVDFQSAVSLYQILPAPLVGPFSRLLPALEFVVGVALLLGVGLEGAWLWSELLYYLFFLALSSVLLRGLQIHCGCFGAFATKITWGHPLLCLAVALLLTRRRLRASRSAPASDSHWQSPESSS